MKIKSIVLAGIMSLIFSVNASETQYKKSDPVPVWGHATAVSKMCAELLGVTDPVKMRDGATKILNETLNRLPDAEVSDEGKNVIEAFVTRSRSPADIPSRCETNVNERYWEIDQAKN
ncbi:periplasmic protein [Salmonella enterica subsp. enterica]|uniref:Periplasmic protein n=1 Tax=Salmonella enterica I TaxID=59201 RepID=A0A379Y1P9_SALET|nr:periplasmic protein [Salmonella enterica subsp. enterica]